MLAAFLVLKVSSAAAAGEASILITPQSGSFVEGSTFESSIFIDTGPNNINAIDLIIKFPPDLLQVAEASTGRSIISAWTAQPEVSNTSGTLKFTGGIVPGINTSRGLISSVKFRVKKAGKAEIFLSNESSVIREGGISVGLIKNRAVLDLLIAPPLGPVVLSPSHLDPARFYKNGNVTLEWDRDVNVVGYSYSFNNDPQDIPDNLVDIKNNRIQLENVQSGIWYFHIKQIREGIWGETTHFPVRVDTIPPESFSPRIGNLVALISRQKVVSFATTDKHSGINHYEIAIVDKDQAIDSSPLFVEAKSPYKLPVSKGPVVVVVRAYDKAGNIRDESVSDEFALGTFFKENWVWMVIILMLTGAGAIHMRRKHNHKHGRRLK